MNNTAHLLLIHVGVFLLVALKLKDRLENQMGKKKLGQKSGIKFFITTK